EVLVDDLSVDGTSNDWSKITTTDILEYRPVTYQDTSSINYSGIGSPKLYLYDFIPSNTLSLSFDAVESSGISGGTIQSELLIHYTNGSEEISDIYTTGINEYWNSYTATYTIQNLDNNMIEYIESYLYYGFLSNYDYDHPTPTLYLDNFSVNYTNQAINEGPNQGLTVDIPVESIESSSGHVIIPLGLSGLKENSITLQVELLDSGSQTVLSSYSYLNSNYDEHNGTGYVSLPKDYIRLPFTSNSFDRVRITVSDRIGLSQSGQLSTGIISISEDQPVFDTSGVSLQGSAFVSGSANGINFYHPSYLSSNSPTEFTIEYDTIYIDDQTYLEFSITTENVSSDTGIRITASGVSSDYTISSHIADWADPNFNYHRIRVRDLIGLENSTSLEKITLIFAPEVLTESNLAISLPQIIYSGNNAVFNSLSGHLMHRPDNY
ncbi:hypothetical protein LCGC14_2698750, partial [marine sediment metagenome]